MSRYPDDPPLECDLVMKGGVTSGVIYPGTVCELATTYRFRSVGGASAGAIAAAATAAAELGRVRGGGFDQLETLPVRLTRNCTNGYSTLFNLFQPDLDRLRPFQLMTAAMVEPCDPKKALARSAWRNYRGHALAGALPGAALAVMGLASGNPWGAASGLAGAGVAVGVGSVANAGRGVWNDLAGLKRFGLCSGMPAATLPPRKSRATLPDTAAGATAEAGTRAAQAPPAPEALTPWLHHELQSLAGLDPDGDPLTFGHLDAAGIELRTMTTNLTQAQPVTLPWANREVYFDPDEFERLFPARVVQWMRDHPPGIIGSPGETFKREVGRAQAAPLLPWPEPRNLPVIVATRMSLSFPGLVQAIPVHTTNWTDPANQAVGDALNKWYGAHRDDDTPPLVADAAAAVPKTRKVRNWFSDGGICANLPVHMFDSPIPTRPTFAVNLDPFGGARPRRAVEAENSYLPADAHGGRFRPWRALDDSGARGMGGFGAAILATARGWVDEQQLTIPGYSGRVVTIFHDPDEGGMNLNMPAEVVGNLSERGAGAGKLLLDQFAGPRPGVTDTKGWTGHRWTRMRLALTGYQQWAARFARAYDESAGTTRRPSYPDLFALGRQGLPAYKTSDSNLAELGRHARDLAEDAATWDEKNTVAGAPTRRPVLRLSTEMDENRET